MVSIGKDANYIGSNVSSNVNPPRNVIRGVNSQSNNETGIHWLRISFDYKQLHNLKTWVSLFYGDYQQDGFGLWSYDSRFKWTGGVQLNYDNDPERCREVHNNRITLEVNGRSLDELSPARLLDFIEGLQVNGGKCNRIDVFFDDYNRTATPSKLYGIIDRGDYSGFKIAHKKQTLKAGKVEHDEVMFGRRGDSGSGKYLRCYDKNLESDGEKDCIRWEVEFSGEKADKVFDYIAKANGSVDAFATICGALVGGAITFIHRTGEKNLSRLDVYDFWSIIVDLLGTLSIRIEKKTNTITGVQEWVSRQVSPSLECLRKCYFSDKEFFGWLFDMLKDASGRMTPAKTELISENYQCLRYKRKVHPDKADCDYANAML